MLAAPDQRSTARVAHLGRLLAIVLIAVACSPGAAPAGVREQAGPIANRTEGAPAGAVSGGAGWRADWERTLAAARSEGKVVVSAQASDSYRLPLTAFEAEYPDIKVEYVGLTAPAFWARVAQERAGGQYLWDVRIGGLDHYAFQARDDGLIDPVRPLLVLPEVVDDGKLLGGLDGVFADKEKQFILVFFAQEAVTLFVNRDLLPATELSGAAQLLDPKLRGRIAMGDPRGGPGLGQLILLLVGYGEDYVAHLLTRQEVVYTQDLRQLAEWMVRGRYQVAMGLSKYQLETFQKEGLGLNVKPLDGPKGQTGSGGGVQVMNRAPHPNAAKVYVNWLLTQRTQAALARSTLFNSRRLDVAPGDPGAVLDSARLHEYIDYQAEVMLPYRERAQQLAKDLLP
jgi:iron(III) transport system substrate-binding protein